MKKSFRLALFALTLGSGLALALPQDGQVVQGQVQIVHPGANILQILQSSPTGIINWGSFSIDRNQLVQFLQPDSQSATLNRVVGRDPSEIFGQLQGNGRVLLVNPNGILFGPGSSVNTGSFLATTLTLSDQDFLQGRYDLHWDGSSPLRAIVNQGEIQVQPGGFLALVSPLIDNQGLLLAERGQVVLGATRQATLTVDPRGLLSVAIPDGFRGGTEVTPQTVLLTPGQMSDTLAGLIQPSQRPESQAIVQTPQGIELVGAEGILLNQGQISANSSQGRAGSILLNSSQATVLASTGQVTANADQGNGGRIEALSAGTTVQMGGLEARSLGGGQGGFVEVSGQHVHMTRAAQAGTFLLDPDFVTIVAGAGTRTPPILAGSDPGTNQTVSASALNTTGTVIVQASQDLDLAPGVRVNLDGNTQLQLSAGNNLTMNDGSGVNATHPNASLSLNAGGAVRLTDLRVPTTHVNATSFVQFNNGTVGQPGSPTVLNVTSGGIAMFAGTTLDVVGTRADVRLRSTADYFGGDDHRLRLQVPAANVSIDAQTAARLGVRGLIQADGSLDLDMASNTGDVLLAVLGTISAGGPANVALSSQAGHVDLRSGTSIVGAPTHLTLSAPAVNVANSTFGQAGSNTSLNISGGSLLWLENSILRGNRVDGTISVSNGVVLTDNSSVTLQSPRSNFNVTTGAQFSLNPGSSWSDSGLANFTIDSGTFFASGETSRLALADPASHLSIHAAGTVDLRGEIAVSHIDAAANTEAFLGTGQLGRPGSPTVVNISAGGNASLIDDGQLVLRGSSTDFNLQAGGFILWGNRSRTDLQGNTNRFVLNAGGAFNQMLANSTFTASGPTQMAMSGSQAALAISGNLSLPEGSTLDMTSRDAIFVNRVQVGGRFTAQASAGNIRILDQLEAQDITLSTVGELADRRSDNLPAIVAHRSLDVRAGTIRGLTDDPALDLVKVFPFATASDASVRFTISGPNDPLFGNRAANLYYYFPQTGNIQVVTAAGVAVRLVNQPDPNPISAPVGPTPEQVAELRTVSAQNQIQMSNLYSAALLPSTSDILMLDFANPGLTSYNFVPLSSALTELVVVSPEEAAEQQASRADAPSSAQAAGELVSYRSSLYTAPAVSATADAIQAESTATSSAGGGSLSLATGQMVEVAVLSPESSAAQVQEREGRYQSDTGSNTNAAGNDEDEETRFWRKLIEGFVIWEED